MNLSNLRRLLGEATRGPWETELGGGHASPRIVGSESVHTNGRERNSLGISSASYSNRVCEFPNDLSLEAPAANAQLITEAINSLEGLLEICEALQAIMNDPMTDMRKSLAEKAEAVLNKHLDKE